MGEARVGAFRGGEKVGQRARGVARLRPVVGEHLNRGNARREPLLGRRSVELAPLQRGYGRVDETLQLARAARGKARRRRRDEEALIQ